MSRILYTRFHGPSKIYGVPGPGLRTGGLKVFLAVKKEGQKLFLTKETWGLVLFFIEKRRGPLFIFLYQKGGQQLFLLVKFWRESLFADNSEPEQPMSLSKSENKLLEITWDPYFEDIEWEYCIFGAVQIGEGVGARSFFEGLNMGANTFFQVPNMGARSFFWGWKSGGKNFFWPVK